MPNYGNYKLGDLSENKQNKLLISAEIPLTTAKNDIIYSWIQES